MSTHADSPRPPIAVVGVSALFPGSSDATGFWNDILEGTDRMTPVPPSHWLVDDYFDAEDRIELSELVVQAKSQDQIAKQIRDSGGRAGHGLRGLPFPLPVR